VVLYELLAGALPLDLRQVPWDQIPRRLREQDAPRPSIKLRMLGLESKVTALYRGVDPPSLARQLRGDLDAITLKALEKERSRRYASPSELAADVNRYLRHETVIARPASAWYRTGKYIRRHRIGVTVATAAVLLALSGAVVQTIELGRITRERDRANRITDFMKKMFKVADPSEARGASVTAREILDKASKEIDSGLDRDRELQAEMMLVMGNVYEGLGLYSRAHPLLERSADIRRGILGPEHLDTLRSMNDLSITLREEGRFAEAEKLDRNLVDVERRVLGPEHPATLESLNNLAATLRDQGRPVEAEKWLREALDIRRRVLGPDNPDTLRLMNNLGNLFEQEGSYAQAEKLYRETLDGYRRVLGPEHPETLGTMSNLGETLRQEGHAPEAEKLLRGVLDVQRRVLGPEHPDTLGTIGFLAGSLASEGHYPEAEKLYRETRDVERRVLGPDHAATAESTYNLGVVTALQGRKDEAFSLLHEALDHGLPPDDALGMENDNLLSRLHGDPRFHTLVEHARQLAAQAGKAN